VRVFAVSPEAVTYLLGSGTYKFIKPEIQKELSENIVGRGLVNLEDQEHKDVRKVLQPAFRAIRTNKSLPDGLGDYQDHHGAPHQ
jgi:cytochrome P450